MHSHHIFWTPVQRTSFFSGSQVATGGDDDAKQLYRKFTIIQSSLKPAECHPEEGIYGEVDEEMLWSYMNEKGQIEDDYQLRKVGRSKFG